MKREWVARLLLIAVLAVVLATIVWGWNAYQSVPVVYASMPEAGGWDPAHLEAIVGEPIHLRLTSHDVTHSFAIGHKDWPIVDVRPGEITEVTLTFDRPGKYTFYCTRWCGPNHWRMRGTIQVAPQPGQSLESQEESFTPLYLRLGLDIDAPHPAQVLPESVPVAAHGSALDIYLPKNYQTPWFYQIQSPAQAWEILRADPLTEGLNDQQVWNLVAKVWQSNTSQARLNLGERLYAQNCAACHGEDGSGEGVFADEQIIGDPTGQSELNSSGHNLQAPVVFTDSTVMLGASPALLEGKILRGGMGTGMPYWGPILNNDQIWALIEYLYTFQFDYETEGEHE